MYCDACWYRHDVASTSADPTSPLPSTSQVTIQASQSSSSTSSNPNPSYPSSSSTPSASTSKAITTPESCAICFEERPEIYGLLSACSHPFCLSCIRSWRQPASKDTPTALSGATKACPACRAPSKFITPSRVFYKAGDADGKKEEVVKAYKARLAKIPCKHFVKNPERPWCPFGTLRCGSADSVNRTLTHSLTGR